MRSVLKTPTNLSDTMSNENACEIDIKTGQKFGVRISVTRGHVTTMIEDSSDISYKQCRKLPLDDPLWKYYNMVIATKNLVKTDKSEAKSNVDILSIRVAA